MLLRSRRGEVMHISEWQMALDTFWETFDKARKSVSKTPLPYRPKDAWERYVRILGLEIVED
jgi:hypothetical protein